jgi:hypothetical protein
MFSWDGGSINFRLIFLKIISHRQNIEVSISPLWNWLWVRGYSCYSWLSRASSITTVLYEGLTILICLIRFPCNRGRFLSRNNGARLHCVPGYAVRSFLCCIRADMGKAMAEFHPAIGSDESQCAGARRSHFPVDLRHQLRDPGLRSEVLAWIACQGRCNFRWTRY